MENGWRYAVFVLTNGGWDRKTALQRDPEELRRFVQDDGFIRALPETDWDIIGGPEALIVEKRIPQALMQDLTTKRLVETVELAS